MQTHSFQTEMVTKCALTAALSLQKNLTSHLSEVFKIIFCVYSYWKLLRQVITKQWRSSSVIMSHCFLIAISSSGVWGQNFQKRLVLLQHWHVSCWQSHLLFGRGWILCSVLSLIFRKCDGRPNSQLYGLKLKGLSEGLIEKSLASQKYLLFYALFSYAVVAARPCPSPLLQRLFFRGSLQNIGSPVLQGSKHVSSFYAWCPFIRLCYDLYYFLIGL